MLKAYLCCDQDIRAELTEVVVPQALALTARARAIDSVVSVANGVTSDVDDTSDWAAHAQPPIM